VGDRPTGARGISQVNRQLHPPSKPSFPVLESLTAKK
jgi:hypothetical protein